MIRTTIGNNLKRSTMTFTHDTTLRSAMEQANIDYTTGLTTLDGATLAPGDMNKTFADLGYDGSEGHDSCFLLNVVKADNAA